MTGLSGIPDTHLPQEGVDKMVEAVLTVPGIFRIRLTNLFHDLSIAIVIHLFSSLIRSANSSTAAISAELNLLRLQKSVCISSHKSCLTLSKEIKALLTLDCLFPGFNKLLYFYNNVTIAVKLVWPKCNLERIKLRNNTLPRATTPLLPYLITSSLTTNDNLCRVRCRLLH
ncbi:hypothetical protein OUZ56_000223 [Daphnia magna]|uniref:Uncharacterized protein n=1 Tax=Daphnia magna TaxID=35525 RepID=A0ABQ9ZZ15_9CRUS|nr:hypothetical protein OUZ56_000223 [Daphnia magna]